MALTIDQQSQFEHLCKICKKGFLCGRALVGHMRVHGIGDDEGGCLDNDAQASDATRDNTPTRGKRMCSLIRTNSHRQKCCRGCENCGKELSPCKSFFEHGKCNLYDVESPIPSPRSDKEVGFENRPHGSGWSKRKKLFTTNVETCSSSEEEEEDLAKCLIMLSNPITNTSTTQELEESCALDHKANGISSINSKGLFECKACKKVFTPHQALGGHRASHKRVKGCFAAKLDHIDHQHSLGDEENRAIENDPTKSISTKLKLGNRTTSPSPLAMPKRKSKVHECSICRRVFNSGQALGGHKRCHWISSYAPDPSSLPNFQDVQEKIEQIQEIPMFQNDRLDLNVPISHDENIMDIRSNTCSNGGLIKNVTNSYDQIVPSNNNKEDEVDSKMKVARICEIKDHMTTNGCSSLWLQVGIGSSN